MGLLDEGSEVDKVVSVHIDEDNLPVWQIHISALLMKELYLLLFQLIILFHLDRAEQGPQDEMLQAGLHIFKKVLRHHFGRLVKLAC